MKPYTKIWSPFGLNTAGQRHADVQKTKELHAPAHESWLFSSHMAALMNSSSFWLCKTAEPATPQVLYTIEGDTSQWQ